VESIAVLWDVDARRSVVSVWLLSILVGACAERILYFQARVALEWETLA
jgi:hypothetical protein